VGIGNKERYRRRETFTPISRQTYERLLNTCGSGGDRGKGNKRQKKSTLSPTPKFDKETNMTEKPGEKK